MSRGPCFFCDWGIQKIAISGLIYMLDMGVSIWQNGEKKKKEESLRPTSLFYCVS